ncbi:MAG: hypothetical protein IKN04_13270 [Clostridia bacterium]|nr:hypothetical protein [Clostridia bacterium]
MKKLVSLILVLAMVLACSVAMAEAPTRKGSANDFEDVPEFFEPIGMKTKRGGDTVTVTLDGEVDSLEVLWYGVGEEFEELEVVDGVAKYNAAGHRYQPGMHGEAMNLTRGTETKLDVILNTLVLGVPYTDTLGQQINGSLINNGTYIARAYNGVLPNIDITNTETPDLPVAYENDALYLVLEEYDDLGNIVDAKPVTSYAVARDIIEEVLTPDDQYRYIDNYDWRVTGNFDDPETGYFRTGGGRMWYWTLEKVIDYNGAVAFKVIQPWAVKVDGAAYKVVIGDVSIYYDRAGKWMYEEIEVADADPFGTGESGTAVYTYSKMVARSNERYYLSKVSCTFEEGEYTEIYQKFLPNAGKSGLYLHIK